jgi:hypothetical protein
LSPWMVAQVGFSKFTPYFLRLLVRVIAALIVSERAVDLIVKADIYSVVGQ